MPCTTPSSRPQDGAFALSVDSIAHPPFQPPLSGRLVWLTAAVRIRPGPDGYPERWRNDRWLCHPMDGRYLIDDYVDSYDERRSSELARAVERVAMASLRRMSEFQGALVFWYEPHVAVRRAGNRRTYSGLTQAYYARSFANAARICGSRPLASAADRCFDSILIPAPSGGVLYDRPEGIAIAQVPSAPRDLVLNGWLSSLVALHEYGRLRHRADAHRLVERSAAYLVQLLPLYDVPRYRTSRYALTGVLRAELRLSPKPARTSIHSASIDVPDEGRFELLLGDRGHWESHLWPSHVAGERYPVEVRGSTVRANLVLSRVGHPARHRVDIDLEVSEATECTLYAHLGRYDPSRASAVDRTWSPIERRSLAPGRTRLTFELPSRALDLVAAPTNFGKVIGDREVNSYHPIHVRRLRQLAERLQMRELDAWAAKWAGYMSDRSRMPLYRGRAALIDGSVVDVASLAGAR